MSRLRWFEILGGLIVVAMLLASCKGAATEAPTASEPTEKEPVIEETVEEPTELKMGLIIGAAIDEPWMKALLQAIERYDESNPHGLSIDYAATEQVWGDDAERAIRTYAETGEYDIIWAASSFADQVKNVMGDYPEILFAYTGSGNYGLGDNAFWTYNHLHECAYLIGVMAGHLTETGNIGAVAAFPYEGVNDSLNGFIDGAKSVNPEVKYKVSFIESWFDPAKAEAAAYAQIASGVDLIFAERFGVYEALQEHGLYGFGHFTDQYEMAPEVVISSTIVRWDPQVEYLVEQWWNHETTGEPYDAPMDPVWFSMAEGGCEIAPYHGFEDELPQAMKDAVLEAKEEMLAGTLEVPLKVEPPETD